MSWLRASLWLAALACGLDCAACQAAPLEAYGKLPLIESAQISPDGDLLAIILTSGEQRNLAVERVDDQRLLTVIKAGDKKVRDVQWAGPSHLLVSTTTTGAIDHAVGPTTEWQTVIDVDLEAHTQLPVLGRGQGGLNVIYGQPTVRTIDGKVYAFVEGVQWVADEGWPALYKVDLNTGHADVEARAKHGEQWLVDAKGDPIAQTEFDLKAGQWRLSLRRNGAWQVVKTVAAQIEHPELLGLGKDGHAVIVGQYEGDLYDTREFALAADEWGPPAPLQVGESLLFDPGTDDQIGTSRIDGDEQRAVFFNPADQAIWNSVAKALPGELLSLVSMSADHRKLVVLADSPTQGLAYCIVDIDAGSAHWLGPAYDKLTPDDIAPVKSISFAAKDGLQLTGYLTIPRGKDPKRLPLIVFPHGGPAARDEPGFDWWAQAMASRGYAVLQVNYRGSDGFGWKFLSAGFGEWGRKMQTDLSDGVRYLAGEGIIDPTRVCIVGASYGGYAALAGATIDLGVYRCAVSIAGPADLRVMLDYSRRPEDIDVRRYWDRFMGVSGPGDSHLEEISPVAHAKDATIPILLIHGLDDTVVPFEQSQLMANALQRAGKPVKLVRLDHEDHWLSRSDTRLQMLQATMDFLEKNNPPS